MGKKIGVVLSGCGVYDGAEIHESVITLLAIDRLGAEAIICAPDRPQLHVVNHLTSEVEEGAERNVLVESARIARGAIRDVDEVTADELDALILPGGFGAAKNLCDFAVKGADCDVDPDVSKLVMDMHGAGKPVGFLCISPAMAAKIFSTAGVKGVKLTIGNDKGTADAITAMGAEHVDCAAGDCVVDSDHKVVSTPAYMLAQGISEVAEGIDKAVAKVLEMMK